MSQWQETVASQEFPVAARLPNSAREAFGFRKMAPMKPLSIIGDSPQIRDILESLAKIAESDANVVIIGEAGTGKELFARTLHALSHRTSHAFVPVDCVAASASALEIELFGSEKRGSSGIDTIVKPGLLEHAFGGTIFLDEMLELDLGAQGRLLRALQDGKYRRVSGESIVGIDTRVIAATTGNPEAALQQKAFRQDLYYLLSIVPLQVPPLRERREDIEPLCREFLQRFANAGAKVTPQFSDEVWDYLQRYSWPGNVRELENAVERIVSLAARDTISVGDLPDFIREAVDNPQESGGAETDDEISRTPGLPLREARQQWVEKFEREYLIDLLNRYNGNISKVAREAGVHRMTIYRMLKYYDITISPRRAQ